jgi:predicted nucleotidyltransferase
MPSFIAEESSNSAKVFWLDQEGLLGEIRRVARGLGDSDRNILKIVLFGSLAEKRAVPGSDADILVVLRADAKPFMDRVADWLDRFALDFPVEVFPYTVEELENPIAWQAMRTGIVLFERSDASNHPNSTQ